MRRFLGAAFAAVFYLVSGSFVRAQDPAAAAVLDKAIKALGGQEKLAKAEAFSWKAKWTIKGLINEYESQVTIQGLDHRRHEVVSGQHHAIRVVIGDKGWHRLAVRTRSLPSGELAAEKQDLYLEAIPVTLLPIRAKGLKYHAAADEKVDDKPAAVLKVTGPDGRDFTLYFDKDSGLPVKEVATIIDTFRGSESAMEIRFGDYKDFDGIKKATKIAFISPDDIEHVHLFELTEFNVLDKVAPETFSEPK